MYLDKKSNSAKVFYSCVVDDTPLFYYQGYIFILSLIYLAKVSGERIFIHLIGQNKEFEKILKRYKINFRYIEKFGDGKWCNKLQQLETRDFLDADYVFLCDADVAITEDLYNYLKEERQYFTGKIVDFDNPPLQILKSLFDYFNLSYPKIVNDTLNSMGTFSCNFNAGLLGMPGKHFKDLRNKWKATVKTILNSEECRKILGNYAMHIDQVSLCITLAETNWQYRPLQLEFNCPIHTDINLVKKKLDSKPLAIHFHNKVTSNGLIEFINNNSIDEVIDKINNVIKSNFNNSLFWNYRYFTNPELGSGIGSRGEFIEYKSKILKNIGIEKAESVLDVGCGDLEIISKFKIKKYFGIDASDQALKIARKRYPGGIFLNHEDRANAPAAEFVVCLDVAIHQETREKYFDLINFLASKTDKTLIISGYNNDIADNSNMCFFYENIYESLKNTDMFKYIFKIGEYRNVDIYVADKGNLFSTKTNNDIKNEDIDRILNSPSTDKDLFLESVIVSRNNFGWFTKHYPRTYEYPWLLKKLGNNLKNLKVADFGSGISPIPVLIAQRGAKVFTIDSSLKRINLDTIRDLNEWGFFDYSIIDKNIKSMNCNLDYEIYDKNFFDIWYSISVIEHMRSEERRKSLETIANTLKNGGKLFLTLDLVKDTKNLWNRSEGIMVEDEKSHGSLDDITKELENLNIHISEKEIISMPQKEKVDIALISAEKIPNRIPNVHQESPIRQEIFCTLGMHRSFTSLTQKILNLMGIFIGTEDKIINPEIDNPKGYWEQFEIVNINDKILNFFNGSWDNPPKFPENWTKNDTIVQLKQEAYDILKSNFQGREAWGFKDPRTSLTLPFWQEIIPDMKYVICIRNPLDVSLSLKKRNGFSIEKGLTLWLHYNISAIQHTNNRNFIFIPCEKLITKPETQINRLYEFIGFQNSETNKNYNDILKFIDKSLFHHCSSQSDLLSTDKIGIATLLYEQICAHMDKKITYDILLQTTNYISKILNYCNYLMDKAIEHDKYSSNSQVFIESQYKVLTYDTSLREITLYQEQGSKKFCQLFFDNGHGFSEKDSTKFFVEDNPELQKFVFDVSELKNVKDFRFDPLNDNCVIELEKIYLVKEDQELDITENISSNAILKKDKVFFFDNTDPQIYIGKIDNISFDDVDKISFSLKCLYTGKEALQLTLSEYKIESENKLKKLKKLLTANFKNI